MYTESAKPHVDASVAFLLIVRGGSEVWRGSRVLDETRVIVLRFNADTDKPYTALSFPTDESAQHTIRGRSTPARSLWPTSQSMGPTASSSSSLRWLRSWTLHGSSSSSLWRSWRTPATTAWCTDATTASATDCISAEYSRSTICCPSACACSWGHVTQQASYNQDQGCSVCTKGKWRARWRTQGSFQAHTGRL